MTTDNRSSNQPPAQSNALLSEYFTDDTLADISAGGSSDPVKKLLTPIAEALDDFFKLFQ